MLAGLALVAYVVRALAWPLTAGRDLDEYLYAYVQLFDRDVLLPWSMLFRTPITPLFAGLSLDVFDGRLAEPLMALLYAGSIVCWAGGGPILRAVGRDRRRGLPAPLPGLRTDVPRALERAGVRRCVRALGTARRPGDVRAVGEPLRARGPRRRRPRAHPPGKRRAARVRHRPAARRGDVARATRARGRVRRSPPCSRCSPGRSTTASASTPGGSRAAATRSSRSTARSSPTTSSRRRTASITPARRGDAAAPPHPRAVPLVRRHARRAFEKGSFRVHEDLYLLSDQVFGWDTDYCVLRDAGVEGVRAHPGTYARGVARTVWDELAKSQFRVVSPSRRRSAPSASSRRPSSSAGSGCPAPTEGEPIPAGQVVWISRPDNSIRQVWTSPTEWHFEFDHPQRPRRASSEIRASSNGLFDALPDRDGQRAARTSR